MFYLERDGPCLSCTSPCVLFFGSQVFGGLCQILKQKPYPYREIGREIKEITGLQTNQRCLHRNWVVFGVMWLFRIHTWAMYFIILFWRAAWTCTCASWKTEFLQSRPGVLFVYASTPNTKSLSVVTKEKGLSFAEYSLCSPAELNAVHASV